MKPQYVESLLDTGMGMFYGISVTLLVFLWAAFSSPEPPLWIPVMIMMVPPVILIIIGRILQLVLRKGTI